MKSREEIEKFKCDLEQGKIDLTEIIEQHQKVFNDTNDYAYLGKKVIAQEALNNNELLIDCLKWVLSD